MDKTQNSFLPLTGAESEKIREYFRKNSVEFVGRAHDKTLLLLKNEPVKYDEFVTLQYRGRNRLRAKQELVLSFTFNREKYYFKAVGTPRGSEIAMDGNFSFYRLVRRGDFRLVLPFIYEADFLMKFYNGPMNIKSRIIDVSASGCLISVINVNSKFAPGEIVRGVIKFQDRPPILVECQIRHIKKINQKDYVERQLGLEFNPQDKELSKKMRAVVLDLYRELFSSFSKRNE